MRKEHQAWLNEFLKNCQNSNKSKMTILNYRSDLQRYISWYETNHSKLLNGANANTIGEYKEFLSLNLQKNLLSQSSSSLAKTPTTLKLKMQNFWRNLFKTDKLSPANEFKKFSLNLAVASRKRHLSTIKNFYEFLKQANEDHNKLFLNNPVRSKLHSIRLKDTDVVHTTLLRDEDWSCLHRKMIHPKQRLLAHVLFYGGLRLAEVTQLRKSQFDFSSKTITFPRKGGDRHTLRIQEAELIFQLLADYLKSKPNIQDYLFCNKKGRVLSTRAMYEIIMRMFKKSGCPSEHLTPHSFRKACATNLYRKTKDLVFVRDYLNHSDAKVTQTYIDKALIEEEGHLLYQHTLQTKA